MGAHHHIHAAALQPLDYLFLLLGGLKAGEKLHIHGETVEPGGYRIIMLLGKYSCRHKHCALLAVHHCLKGSPERYFGLTIAHIAAEQAVHHLVALHVRLYLLNACELIRRRLIRKAILQLSLPRCIRRKLKALAFLPLAVKAHKVEGQLLYAVAGSGYGFLPFAAAQL